MRLLIYLFFCSVTLSFFSACHTVEGFGKDVEAVGEKLGREADEHRIY